MEPGPADMEDRERASKPAADKGRDMTGDVAGAHLPKSLRKMGRTQDGVFDVVRMEFDFHRSFVPRAAVRTILDICNSRPAATELIAEESDAAVLIVDISGFTALCDRFQAYLLCHHLHISCRRRYLQEVIIKIWNVSSSLRILLCF